MDYGCQLYKTASTGSLKKLDNIHSKGIRVYTGAFRTLPVEVLHVEANDTPLELRRNELGQIFLYKLKSNTSCIGALNALDREDQNYEEIERLIKLKEVYLRRLEQRYMEGDRRDESDTATLMVGKQILFCQEGEIHTGNDNDRKQEAYTDRSKSTGWKVDFTAIVMDITRREALPE